jgi:hypothetical protein
MKLKLDENGKCEVIDGNPVVIKDNGDETVFDINTSVSKISTLKHENDTFKTTLAERDSVIGSFNGINPEEALKALAIMKNLDDKTLVDASEIQDRHKQELKTQAEAFQLQINESSNEVKQLIESNRIEKLTAAFANSKFISDKTILPAKAALALYGHNFKVEKDENGTDRLVPYVNGARVLSSDNIGENGSFDDGLLAMVNGDSDKDRILKSSVNGGSGSGGGQNNGVGNIDLSHLSPTERLTRARQQAA